MRALRIIEAWARKYAGWLLAGMVAVLTILFSVIAHVLTANPTAAKKDARDAASTFRARAAEASAIADVKVAVARTKEAVAHTELAAIHDIDDQAERLQALIDLRKRVLR